jgi:hypothetical protein
MMGDLPATSYICGLVCFPVRTVVTTPPVVIQPPVVVPPPDNPDQPPPGPGATPGAGQAAPIVIDGRTSIVTSQQCRYLLVPQVGRGAIKIQENESPRPTDRAYVTYNY